MTLTIELSPQIEEQLAEIARQRGIAVDQVRQELTQRLRSVLEGDLAEFYLRSAISPSLPGWSAPAMPEQVVPPPFYATATPEEWERAFLNWTESHSVETPILPPEAFEREAIYEEYP